MGLFDSSSRSNSNTDANTTGGQSQSGSVAVPYVDGNNNSVQVMQQVTDLDAIKAGVHIGTAGLDTASNIVGRGLDIAERLGETAINTSFDGLSELTRYGERVLSGAADLVRDAMREASYQTENALAAASDGLAQGAALSRDAIDSNTLISRDAINLSESVINLTDDLHEQNTSFLRGTMTDFTDSVTRLDQSRSRESEQSLAAITELATVVQTGGESINSNVNKMIAAIALLVAGAIAWRALA